MSKNTNCLEGIQCPKCGQAEEFRVQATSVFELFDEGTGDHSDVEYDDDAWTLCPHCEYEGEMKTFMTRRPHREHLRDIDPGDFQEGAQMGAAHMQAWAHEGDV